MAWDDPSYDNRYETDEDYNLGPEYRRANGRIDRNDLCLACDHTYSWHDGFKGECTYSDNDGVCFCTVFDR